MTIEPRKWYRFHYNTIDGKNLRKLGRVVRINYSGRDLEKSVLIMMDDRFGTLGRQFLVSLRPEDIISIQGEHNDEIFTL